MDTYSRVCVSGTWKNRKWEESCYRDPTGGGGLAELLLKGRAGALLCFLRALSCLSCSFFSPTFTSCSSCSLTLHLSYIFGHFVSRSVFIGRFFQSSNCETLILTEPSGFTINVLQLTNKGVVPQSCRRIPALASTSALFCLPLSPLGCASSSLSEYFPEPLPFSFLSFLLSSFCCNSSLPHRVATASLSSFRCLLQPPSHLSLSQVNTCLAALILHQESTASPCANFPTSTTLLHYFQNSCWLHTHFTQ